jgi:hypothetical protein
MSHYDLGLALGLSPKNADRAVRDWEELGPSGPAGVALHLIESAIDGRDLEAELAALFQLQLPLEG